MSGVALPLLGVLFVFGVVMPLCALLARGALRLLARSEAHAGLHGHGALRYALLVAPTALPFAWVISACLHQAESGTGPDVCAIPDPPGVMCPEVAFFAAALVLLVALAALPRLVREQRALRGTFSVAAAAARRRVEGLLRAHADLAPLAPRVILSDASAEPIATRGVFTPRVVLHTSFVQGLDDGALIGALRHEAQHVRARDPLRYFIAWWALQANPLGRWLLGSASTRWILAREIHCDREAVLSGASAPALAQALLNAARFAAPLTPGLGLRAPSAEVLRLRIELLMAYADRRPHHCCRAPALRFVLCALAFATALPHQFGADPLDTLHRAAESAASVFLPEQE